VIKTSDEILRQMDAKQASVPVDQNLEIAPGLRGLYNTERIRLLWHRKILRILTGDLQEDSRIWAALVCLASAVQEARPKS